MGSTTTEASLPLPQFSSPPGPYQHQQHSMGGETAPSLVLPLKRYWFMVPSSKPFSLPFKKRRFVVIAADDNDQDQEHPNDDSIAALGSPTRRPFSVVPPSTNTTSSSSTGNSAGFDGSSSAACVTPVPTSKGSKCRVELPPLVLQKLGLASPPTNTDLVMAAPSLVPSHTTKQHAVEGDDSLSSLPSEATPRAVLEPSEVVVPPLKQTEQGPKLPSSKLPKEPTGCHATTSRTHAYCKRGPNYKGSNYCKLHYFDPRYSHLIGNERNAGSNEPHEEPQAKDSIATVTTSKNAIESTKTESSHAPPGLQDQADLPNSKKPKSKQHHRKRVPRDKLYRGCTSGSDNEEIRCLAISTRGKRCCYSAVASNGDKYCHRHSSFYVPAKSNDDTSGASSSDDVCATRSKGAQQQQHGEESQGPTEPLGSNEDQPRPPTALSDLSTDLWQNRKVLVSKGPHKSRVGTVAKWRNGWVTVELIEPEEQPNTKPAPLPKVCYHNRRSYELFLV